MHIFLVAFAALVTLGAAVHSRSAHVLCTSLSPPTVEHLNATLIDFSAETSLHDNTSLCQVNVYITHPGAGDRVHFQFYLPEHAWTGRYLGTGGSGMAVGRFGDHIAPFATQGFAVGATDGGLPANSADGSLWAHDEQLVRNFAHLSIHELAIIGPKIATQLYGSPVRHSYFTGCSAGGRQGYIAAERHPDDYAGIFAGAPAFNFPRLRIAQLFPFLVQSANAFPPLCIWQAFQNATLEACDMLDGGRDGIIAHPDECRRVFDPMLQVGRSISCNETDDPITITASHAEQWRQMSLGPIFPNGTQAYHGYSAGTSFLRLTRRPPIAMISSWVRDFIMRNDNFDLQTIKPEDAHDLMALSVDMYQPIIGSDPDLARFRDTGGKLLSWHGWTDDHIFPDGTVEYRHRVEQRMGGSDAADEFYRLFMAPGVDHCGGGVGAAPSDGLGVLVDWVEEGRAPEVLPAHGSNGIRRNLCLFPRRMVFEAGDMGEAESWRCV